MSYFFLHCRKSVPRATALPFFSLLGSAEFLVR